MNGKMMVDMLAQLVSDIAFLTEWLPYVVIGLSIWLDYLLIRGKHEQ